jgi:hypothetical protein
MNERLKVKYPSGFETAYKPEIAKILEKRGQVKILGTATAAPKPENKGKKIDRDALVKKAIKEGLASKEECVAFSDSELADLVGKDE